ncbi:ryncolin-2-like isoform X3 [Dreissena polymorpha]|uniref:ryncolin-2-like isoform X3 n=1 Tax=Dreissena polymorpha TaxID=45954 RepID=UPI00226546E2|nr:ryncolin-2-like isoform X3 [Dreissena polymorpha]
MANGQKKTECIKVCPPFENNSNGNVTGDSLFEGATRNLTCDSGYSPRDDKILVSRCQNGHWTNITECVQVKDCTELLNRDSTKLSGVYTIITPVTHTKVQVFCDMEKDGGGWTVFQKRFNGSEDFYRNFSDYEKGFGTVYAEHWLGLKNIYEMTSHGSNQLRVDIVRSNGSSGYNVYEGFSLQPGTNYTLNVGSRIRSDGLFQTTDSFSDGNPNGIPVGNAFSTYDHDVDRGSGTNCAAEFKGGWWYNNCYGYINLNGLYRPGQSGFEFMTYDSRYGLAASTMMFKSVS